MCFPLSGSRRCGRIPPELVVCKRVLLAWTPFAQRTPPRDHWVHRSNNCLAGAGSDGPGGPAVKAVTYAPPEMTQPMHSPDPAAGYLPSGGSRAPGRHAAGGGSAPDVARNAVEWRAALVPSLAVVAGTALLGVAGGYLWAAVAPRVALVVVGRGAADLVNSDTRAFIAADGWYCVICLVGGVISGLLGYWLVVRRHGPVPMAGVLIGGLAAGLITSWIGEQSGLATFHHLLATLPAGAHMQSRLTLGSLRAIDFLPLAAGLMAGGVEAISAMRERHRTAAPLALAPPGYPGAQPGYPGAPTEYPGAPTGYPGAPPGYPGAPPGYPQDTP